MILNITQSKLFTVEPARRFANEHHVSPDIWKELWRRYKFQEYTISELCEIYYIKVGKPIRQRSIRRWIFRMEVYIKTKPMIDKGAQAVNSSFFGELEQKVIDEVLKHIKSGDIKNTKILA